MRRDRNKQIEEMAKIACVGFNDGNCENCKSVGICSSYTISKKLYNAGYRKSDKVVMEIFKSIRTECVDSDGYFLYGNFMILQLDTIKKYTEEGK